MCDVVVRLEYVLKNSNHLIILFFESTKASVLKIDFENMQIHTFCLIDFEPHKYIFSQRKNAVRVTQTGDALYSFAAGGDLQVCFIV